MFCDNAMARNHDCDWISAAGTADGARTRTQLARQFAVALRRARRNVAQCVPNAALKRRSRKQHWHIKDTARVAKIITQLRDGGMKQRVRGGNFATGARDKIDAEQLLSVALNFQPPTGYRKAECGDERFHGSFLSQAEGCHAPA